MNNSDPIALLDSMVAERSLLKHPFYQQWTRGQLKLKSIRNYAAQYYRHVEAFPRYLSAIHSRCGDAAVRQALLENLIEEERGAENHPELWLRFAEGLGMSREQVLGAPALPATADLVNTFTRLSREGTVAAGLAGLYVYESQLPAVATAKIEGLKRFYQVSSDRALSFFTVHQEADVYHARTGAELIAREAKGPRDAQEVLEAGDQALGALWNMLSAVDV